jgi:hypothetical protein
MTIVALLTAVYLLPSAREHSSCPTHHILRETSRRRDRKRARRHGIRPSQSASSSQTSTRGRNGPGEADLASLYLGLTRRLMEENPGQRAADRTLARDRDHRFPAAARVPPDSRPPARGSGQHARFDPDRHRPRGAVPGPCEGSPRAPVCRPMTGQRYDTFNAAAFIQPGGAYSPGTER